MSKAGRPVGWTPELQDEMVAILLAGNYVETACAIVGLAKSTFYDWTKWGRQARDKLKKNPKAKLTETERVCLGFSDAVKKASAEAEAKDLALISQAAEFSWQAAAWRLERKFPDRWGRRAKRDDDEQDARIEKIKTDTEKAKTEIRLATQTEEELNASVERFTDAMSAADIEGIYDEGE